MSLVLENAVGIDSKVESLPAPSWTIGHGWQQVVKDNMLPGDVRELRAEVNQWHVFCDKWVRPENIDPKFASPAPTSTGRAVAEESAQPLAKAVAQAEREAITNALLEAKNNLSRAARILLIDRNSLKRKIRKHEIPYQALPTGRPADPW